MSMTCKHDSDACPHDEDFWRQHEREVHGCNCACVRVHDFDRIISAGGDPTNPRVFVFHHTDECHMTRIHRAPNN